MKFTVITYGTEGDSRPLLGLSQGLAERGHDVLFMADRSTFPSQAIEGIDMVPLAGDIRTSVNAGGALGEAIGRTADPGRIAKAVARIAAENTESWMQDLRHHANDSDAILFSGIASYVGLSVAEFLSKPAIGLGLWPMSPTTAFPSPLVPPWRLPGWLNKLTHRSMNALLWQMFKGPVNRARRRVFGQPPRQQMWRDYPILYGVSPHLVPQPNDWSQHWRICGEWSLKTPHWAPPGDLLDFLQSGPPPLYVGFGSMSGFDRDRILSVVLEAVGNRRAIFSPGWADFDTKRLPSNFFAVGSVPHTWLFQRVSMVVHHGGAGTSHTAARAGVPSVVLPFAGDQPFWARRLADVGVAPAFIPAAKIKACELARMIEFVEQPSVQRRAKALGAAMAKEDGIAASVEQIERLALGHSRSLAGH